MKNCKVKRSHDMWVITFSSFGFCPVVMSSKAIFGWTETERGWIVSYQESGLGILKGSLIIFGLQKGGRDSQVSFINLSPLRAFLNWSWAYDHWASDCISFPCHWVWSCDQALDDGKWAEVLFALSGSSL